MIRFIFIYVHVRLNTVLKTWSQNCHESWVINSIFYTGLSLQNKMQKVEVITGNITDELSTLLGTTGMFDNDSFSH